MNKRVLLLYYYYHHHQMVERMATSMKEYGVLVDVLCMDHLHLVKNSDVQYGWCTQRVLSFFKGSSKNLVTRIFRRLFAFSMLKSIIKHYDLIDFHVFSLDYLPYMTFCKEKGITFDITLWGSDIMRANDDALVKKRWGFEQCRYIKCAETLHQILDEKYKSVFVNKVKSVYWGNPDYEYIDALPESDVKAYRDEPMNSYTNMTNGQAFYKPMLQVVDYLIANDFKVYIVSGTDRLITRGLADGIVNIPVCQMIGSDESLVATGQGDTDGLNYTFTQDDKLVTGGDFLIKNLKTNKVTVIQQEIGVQPVLSFGNSSGDASMANFTITNNKYKSAAFMLCCDDTERENGNVEKAESMRKSCEENGWTAVSMKNDWTTIYGDGVTYNGNVES